MGVLRIATDFTERCNHMISLLKEWPASPADLASSLTYFHINFDHMSRALNGGNDDHVHDGLGWWKMKIEKKKDLELPSTIRHFWYNCSSFKSLVLTIFQGKSLQDWSANWDLGWGLVHVWRKFNNEALTVSLKTKGCRIFCLFFVCLVMP